MLKAKTYHTVRTVQIFTWNIVETNTIDTHNIHIHDLTGGRRGRNRKVVALKKTTYAISAYHH